MSDEVKVKAFTADINENVRAIEDPELVELGERIAHFAINQFNTYASTHQLRNDMAASIIASLAVNIMRVNCALTHAQCKEFLLAFSDAWEQARQMFGPSLGLTTEASTRSH